MMLNVNIDKFQKCLVEKRFYDAHEALEDLWFPRRFEDNAEVKLLKGFINAAVSFELSKRGRKEQSKRVWDTYLKYKSYLATVDSPYLSLYHTLVYDVESIARELAIISPKTH
jgi:hypothetical protein